MDGLRLNLGCGQRTIDGWQNLDFHTQSSDVIQCNLLDGIPYDDESAQVIYHSHVLEHFTKKDGINFIQECFRVLAPGGIIRVVIPDLEEIARSYLNSLNDALMGREYGDFRYDWSINELIDQLIRTESGGEAKLLLSAETIPDEEFVFRRWGQEARQLRHKLTRRTQDQSNKQVASKDINLQIGGIRGWLAKMILKPQLKELGRRVDQIFTAEKALRLGQFRLSGEVHLWMYDKYSLTRLLKNEGFVNIEDMDAYSSRISGWSAINPDLDQDSKVRKPDSLFIEAEKSQSS